MRRLARSVPFARRRYGAPVRDLTALPVTDWPRQLGVARSILVDELAKSDGEAVVVLQSCLSAAQACADAMNWRAREAFHGRNRERLRRIFARTAKCAKRLPASKQRLLNRKISAALSPSTIDSEAIEDLIDALITTFGEWPRLEQSLTVLGAVLGRSSPTPATASSIPLRRRFAEAALCLREDYSALRPMDQRGVESSLIALSERTGDEPTTAEVCTAISGALTQNETHISLVAHDLITDYVTAVARVWERHGLRASRARNPLEAVYHSRFHRFADLVLTSLIDPWSRRYLEERRATHEELAQDSSKAMGSPARQDDFIWLVSEDHVRKALARIQKSDPPTP